MSQGMRGGLYLWYVVSVLFLYICRRLLGFLRSLIWHKLIRIMTPSALEYMKYSIFGIIATSKLLALTNKPYN